MAGNDATGCCAGAVVSLVLLTALVTAFVVYDGESIWLEGLALIGLYCIVASAFWWGWRCAGSGAAPEAGSGQTARPATGCLAFNAHARIRSPQAYLS